MISLYSSFRTIRADSQVIELKNIKNIHSYKIILSYVIININIRRIKKDRNNCLLQLKRPDPTYLLRIGLSFHNKKYSLTNQLKLLVSQISTEKSWSLSSLILNVTHPHSFPWSLLQM